MISAAQIRAARSLLGWTSRELARRAIVSDATVYALEHVVSVAANPSTLAVVQATLEAAGIEFLDGGAPGGNFDEECGRAALTNIQDRIK
jgi:transcriptional regulator with XRE-family HTH domain